PLVLLIALRRRPGNAPSPLPGARQTGHSAGRTAHIFPPDSPVPAAPVKTRVVQQLLARHFCAALTLTRPSAVPVPQEAQSSVGSWLSPLSKAPLSGYGLGTLHAFFLVVSSSPSRRRRAVSDLWEPAGGDDLYKKTLNESL